MIFIFGLDDGKVEETETNNVEKCPRCGNVSRWIAAKQTMRASFFFIPVIPVKKSTITIALFAAMDSGFQKKNMIA